jgi:HK97 family phage major capsid protein
LNARYLPAPAEIADDHKRFGTTPDELDAVAHEAEATLARRRNLKPSKRELALQVVVRDSLMRAIAAYPEVAAASKEDIAWALADAADAAFLHGDGRPGPQGIAPRPNAGVAPAADHLETARAMLKEMRNRANARFANPGWVIDVRTLDELTRLLTKTNSEDKDDPEYARTLDSTRLLMLDGDDSGVLLGYPFVATTAAQQAVGRATKSRMYFSADWSEAWIGIGEELVTVAVSTETAFRTDETVVRAVMHHDFAVRNPNRFAYTKPF